MRAESRLRRDDEAGQTGVTDDAGTTRVMR